MFNRFNICRAWYVYALECHSGQFSRAYKIFGRLEKLQFAFGGSNPSYEGLDEEEKLIYDGLVAQNY
jgi:hypothetical protein